MNQSQREKLERYFRNADKFMWGVIPGNKRTVFAALRAALAGLGEDGNHFIPDNKKTTYAVVIENLLTGIGIEKILSELVAVQAKKQFGDRIAALDFLRAHWMSGTLPRWKTLQSLRARKTMKQILLGNVVLKSEQEINQETADILDAFVEVNTQYEYVHGWSTFAGLWFEDIEPWFSCKTETQQNR
jgi:hypothetical protein